MLRKRMKGFKPKGKVYESHFAKAFKAKLTKEQGKWIPMGAEFRSPFVAKYKEVQKAPLKMAIDTNALFYGQR